MRAACHEAREAGGVQEGRGVLDLALAHVDGEQHGLFRQKRVVAQAATFLVVERDIPERPFRFERFLQLEEDHALRYVFGAISLLDAGVETLEALLHGTKVGEDQLEVEHRRVTQRIDRALGMGNHARLEGAYDVDQRVDVPQRWKIHERRALALGDTGNVHILDARERLLLGIVELRQGLDPKVRDPGDA